MKLKAPFAVGTPPLPPMSSPCRPTPTCLHSAPSTCAVCDGYARRPSWRRQGVSIPDGSVLVQVNACSDSVMRRAQRFESLRWCDGDVGVGEGDAAVASTRLHEDFCFLREAQVHAHPLPLPEVLGNGDVATLAGVLSNAH